METRVANVQAFQQLCLSPAKLPSLRMIIELDENMDSYTYRWFE